MAQNDFLSVRPGDKITADIWNQLLKSVDRADVLYGGENTRVAKYPHGTFVNAKHIAGWLHPWRVLVSTTAASVYPGLINGKTPVIKDGKGNDKSMTDRPPPLLLLNDHSFSNQGTGWVALELETTKDPNDKSDTPNMYAAIKTARVIQCQMITGAEKTTNNPFFYFGFPGIGDFKVRYPLARLQRVGKGRFNVFQVAMFNLNWKAKPPTPLGGTNAKTFGSAFPRHFFWPA